MKWLVTVLLGGLLALVPVLANGQDDEARLAAARELLQSMDLGATTRNAMEVAMDGQVKANPALAPYRDTMVAWTRQYITWEEMEPKFVACYAEAFTEQEMRDMIAFYRTPSGRKALVKLPELLQKGMEIGQALVKTHQPELTRMIEERRKELDAK